MMNIRIFAWAVLILLALTRVVFINYSGQGNLKNFADLCGLDFSTQKVLLSGTIISYPDVRDKETKIIVRADSNKVISGAGAGTSTASVSTNCELKIDGDILVHKKGRLDVRPGDIIKVSGKLTKPRNFLSLSKSGFGNGSKVTTEGASQNAMQFDYVGYLLAQNVVYAIKSSEILEIRQGSPPPWVIFRDKFETTIKHMIPEPQSSLALGVLLGGKSSLGKVLVEEFRSAGILHMVVLSGYNVAVIISLVTYLLGFLSIKLRFICIIGAVWVFADMVGGGSTVIRASIMALAPHLAGRLGFKHSGIASLFFAGTVMVIVNPYILISDPSFHLSFLATFGILVFCRPLLSFVKLLHVPDFFAEQIATTISAQIWVTPYLLKAMGMLSLMTLISNMSTSSFVPPLMASTFFAGVLEPLLPSFAYLFGLISYYLASYIFAVAHYVSAIPHSVINGLNISIWEMWGIYMIMLVVYFCLRQSKILAKI